MYDAPRAVTLTMPDGTRKTERVMSSIVDKDTGEMTTINDLTNQEFEVFGTIGAIYNTVKQETFEQLGKMAAMVAPADPKLMTALLMKQITLVDGVAMDDIRDYARKQLVLGGFSEPNDDEEAQMLQQAQESQGQQQDPNAMIGQAEMQKAQALTQDVQRKAMVDQSNAQIDQGKLLVEQFKAQTGRLAVQIDAQTAGANTDLKRGDALRARVDQALKARDSFRAQIA